MSLSSSGKISFVGSVFPRTIISNNGPQFDSQVYRNLCQELKIKNLYSTPRYPQSNDQIEASNKTLLTALKKRLDTAKGKWVDKLPGVLWAYRRTVGRPTDISPFALTYGMYGNRYAYAPDGYARTVEYKIYNQGIRHSR